MTSLAQIHVKAGLLRTAAHRCRLTAAPRRRNRKTVELKKGKHMGEQKEIFKEMQIVERYERRLARLEGALEIALDRIRRLEISAQIHHAQPPVDAVSKR